ncbi:Cell envelope-related transcriptional attenuator [Moorella glycerini]|uniref:Transcriptional regulator LytR n=1 Tax=Neomoorella stamsii TaxID=1266720 RepID=A0A9X7J0R1_9FIRM|nr:Transcriptional regulator LytR [Moorella stamsii]CEP68453.1 Cell envelope-related transcriptional attenuator [Moorella glycerini]
MIICTGTAELQRARQAPIPLSGRKIFADRGTRRANLASISLGEELMVATPDRHQTEFWGEGAALARRQRRSSLLLIFGIILLAFFTFGAFAFAGYRLANLWLAGGLATGQGDKDGSGLAEAAPGQPQTILLIGIDRRQPQEPSRSDTIILAVLDPRKPQVDLLSIPRDTQVKIPGHGYDKINAAHALGGPRLLMDTLNNFLGTHIEKYVEVDFQGFEKIIDILGGVDINVDKRMYYPEEGINLRPGLQHLNGYDALGYVRFRNDPEGDITRIGRQQKFLQALIDQTLRLSTIPKIPRLVSEISKEVKTNLSLKEMLSLALSMKDLNGSDVTAHLVPGEGKYINGISYYLVDQKKLAETLAAIPNLR